MIVYYVKQGVQGSAPDGWFESFLVDGDSPKRPLSITLCGDRVGLAA
jgi:hypothetical protein